MRARTHDAVKLRAPQWGMPNFSSLLKSEICRLARKEIRLEVEPLKRSNASFRSEIVSLKKLVRELQSELKQARRAAKQPPAEEPATSELKFRYRASTLKAHRARLGISAADYGALLGVSALSVYKWEDDKVTPRPKMLPAIAAVLRMGKREALRRLQELQSA